MLRCVCGEGVGGVCLIWGLSVVFGGLGEQTHSSGCVLAGDV